MASYILVVDSDEEVVSVETTALKFFYGGEVIAASSHEDMKSYIVSHGKPEAIVIDDKILSQSPPELLHFLSEKQNYAPVIVTAHQTMLGAHTRSQIISAVIEKPINSQSFSTTVKGLLRSHPTSPIFVPVNFNMALLFPLANYDYFLCLSSNNFVKAVNKGDPFTKEDALRLKAKGFEKVFIQSSDCMNFLGKVESELWKALETPPAGELDHAKLVIDAFENVESISKTLGWTPEIISNAQKAISVAVKVFSKNKEISEILALKLKDSSSSYAKHVGLTSYLCCALGSNFEWVGESGQQKLVMATLLHDLAVDEGIYQDIRGWNERASNLKDKSEDVTKYRLHMIEASNKINTLSDLPPDVIQIILQHHERPDGQGFPRSLNANRIAHLAMLFIMVEDLVEVIGDAPELKPAIESYLTSGATIYTHGKFKKFFDIIREDLEPRI